MKPNYVPQNLRQSILMGIRTFEYQRAKRFLMMSTATGLVSLLGIAGSLWYLVTTFYQSSFYYYLTLVFTDTDLVLPYWREFALSLAETLPLFSLTLVLAALVAFLVSLRIFINNTRADLTWSFNS